LGCVMDIALGTSVASMALLVMVREAYEEGR
jgi:hypothetical protein